MPKNELYKYDFILIIAVTLTVSIGILTIYSAGFDPIVKINTGLYSRQLLWFLIGFIVMLIMTMINYSVLGELSPYIYGSVLFILLLTSFFGTPIRNTKAWINLGILKIQPSEFMKLAYVIVLAKYLELRERDIKNFRELLIPALLTIIPVVFIIIQPDLGTAMIFIPILFTMLFAAGADIAHLMSILIIAGFALLIPIFSIYKIYIQGIKNNIFVLFFEKGSTVYTVSIILLLIAAITYVLHVFFIKKLYRKIYIPSFVLSLGLFIAAIVLRNLHQHQIDRIIVFLKPEYDPHGLGYNVMQSKIAIGSGGFFGKGFLAGTQSQLGYLPEKPSDFIFPVVAEEWGFLGITILLLLLFFIILRGLMISLEARDKFAALLATGITSIFFFHILINVGMVIGLVPVTGLPLCFVSYGGSNILMAMICIGILLNINIRKFAN